MGLLSNVWGLFGNSSKQFYENKNYYISEEIGNTNPIMIDMTDLEKVYHEIPHLKDVINQNANMLASGNFVLKDSNNEIIEKSPYLDLLSNPNPLQSQKEFFANLSIQEDIFGNAFIRELKAFYNSIPSALYVLPSRLIEVVLSGKVFDQRTIEEIISYYKLTDSNQTIKYDVNEIIHFRQSDSRLILAKSKVETLRQQLSNIKQAYESRNKLITSNGALRMITYDSNEPITSIDPKDKKELEEKFQNNYGIAKGQRSTLFSTTPLKNVPLSFPTKDFMLFEEVQDNFNIIIDTFGQKKELFSTDSDAKFSNYEVALKSVYQNNIIPRGKRFAETLTKAIIKEDNQYFDYVLDLEFMKEDEEKVSRINKDKYDLLVNLVERNVITEQEFNEKARDLLNI